MPDKFVMDSSRLGDGSGDGPGLGPNSDADAASTLGPFSSTALLVIYTLVYVVPLYVSQRTRPSPTLSRDSPLVIRARIFSATLSTVLCSVVTFIILSVYPRGHSSPLHAMGWWPFGLDEALRSLVLVGLLYAGPLYETLLIDGGWKDCSSLETLRHLWCNWVTWRNLVAGPVTEEILFRSAAVPLLVRAEMSLVRIIFVTPLVFGLAHIHHFYEFRITHPQVPISVALARSVLQLTYTTLFGAYATFLFLRTGRLFSVILVHTFCNLMGLPRLWGRLYPHWLNTGGSSPDKATLKWTILYYFLLIAGCVGWRRQLWTLTQSPGALVSWD